MNARKIGALAVLVVLGLVFYFGMNAYRDQTQAEQDARVVVEKSRLVRMHSPIIGPQSAPVTIVEFFDPSCEACRAFFPLVKNILATYPDDVRVVIRYTTFHKGSDEAVRILEAARKQDKFEPVLAALVDKQPEWATHGEPDMKRAWNIAGEAGLELMGARLDSVKPEVDQVLQTDLADVKANNVEQTPTFFVNGKLLSELGPQQLSALVAAELQRTRKKP